MRSTRRTILLKLAASAIPLAAGLSHIMKKAADYSVAKGDTLSGIAKRHGTTWQNLAQLNGIANPDKLVLGQKIRLPEPVQAPAAQPKPATPPPASRSAPAAPAPVDPATARLNRVSAYLHRKLGNPNLESAILANFDRETGGKFDYATKEVGGGGYGLPQYTGASLKAYRAWLVKNRLADSENSQLDYFTDVYMPSRPGYRAHVANGGGFTREQQADWLHRSVFTPAHTIRSHAGYDRAKILKYTLAHNAFMKNRLRAVNGVWQGV